MSQEVILMERLRYTNLINILKDNKIKVIFPSVLLSATLVLGGCSVAPENSQDTSSNEIITSAITDGAGMVASEVNTVSTETYEKVMNADTVVEKSISGTIELASSISNATDEYKQSEQYKEDVERLKTEFNSLVDWLQGKTEIHGYTINDVGSTTIQAAKDAISYIDGVIESYIPDYKEKAKEKAAELGDFAWDKATDAGAWVLNKGEEFADEVERKR